MVKDRITLSHTFSTAMLCVWLVAAAPAQILAQGAASQAQDSDSLLARVGEAVDAFERQLPFLLGRETYTQRAFDPNRGEQRRVITSELGAALLSGTSGVVFLRHVLTVDGRDVVESRSRLEALLSTGAQVSRDRILAIRDEGARFNVGTIHRNLNDPTLGLRLLGSEARKRLAIQMKGLEQIDGAQVRRFDFRETARPTVVRNRGSNVPLFGSAWVDNDGNVRQTTIQASFVGASAKPDEDLFMRTTARVTVHFAHDLNVHLWVPTRMDEQYANEGETHAADGATLRSQVRERIECLATYADYRRFETSVRVLP